MSRSFKKPVPGTKSIRVACCVVNHRAMGKWKEGYNRNLRRKWAEQTRAAKDDPAVEDEMSFEYKKNPICDEWSGPSDGRYLWDFDDYNAWIK